MNSQLKAGDPALFIGQDDTPIIAAGEVVDLLIPIPSGTEFTIEPGSLYLAQLNYWCVLIRGRKVIAEQRFLMPLKGEFSESLEKARELTA